MSEFQEFQGYVGKKIEYYNENPSAEGVNDVLGCAMMAAEQFKEKDYALELSTYCKNMCAYLIFQEKYDIYKMLDFSNYCKINQITVKELDSWWKCILFEAQFSLEAFILYMEKNRAIEKQFYVPRMKTLQIVLKDLEDLENRKYKFYGLSMPSRVGKALAWNTPVLTNNGWKNHGELNLMDKVVGIDGEYKDIIAIHNKCNMEYKVTFSDGEEIICHGNHEWVMDARPNGKRVVVETKKMFEDFKYASGRLKYQVPLKQVMEGRHNSLWVAPYTIGAWLGDGRNSHPDICCSRDDIEIVNGILEDGYEISWKTQHKTTGVLYYGFKGLRQDIQKYGMCYSRRRVQKRIPEEYLCADIEQRLELLAGLLDTDGCLIRKEHRYQFTTNEICLKDSFVALVNTFGWRTSVTEVAAKKSSSGIIARKNYYVISFNPTMHIPCRLERKKLYEFSKQRKVSVVNVEKIKNEISGNCITVDGGIYCVGKTMKPTHNSTICIFFLAWIMCKRPNSHSAMGGHSGILAKGFYKELLNLIDTEEYTFKEIFESIHPNATCLRAKSADEFTITLDEPDRFASITCRGIDGTWTGAVDVSKDGYLYVDDLVRDREHSLSPLRMEATFQEYLNKMVDRKNDGARELMVGTLWNVLDPLERMRELYENNPEYKFRRIPALDENDESNFQYTYNGFSTEYYKEMRERLDSAEWMAKFQQRPFVREGIVFTSDNLTFWNGILEKNRKYELNVVCDPAFGGGDSVSMPIGLLDVETDITYVIDWLFDNAGVTVTIPRVVKMIMKHGIRNIRVEKNNGGHLYASKIKEELDKEKYSCYIEERPAPQNISKVDKILGEEDKIRDKFVFLDNTQKNILDYDENEFLVYNRSADYTKALDEVYTFVRIGKVKHDDGADSLAQLSIKTYSNYSKTMAVIMRSPF